ncbi:ubiquinone biosynthesis O-methyltransferase, mitochondrial-like isoform X2 [Telopea speciosissima]|uniref:ubiquinone biosynthesis O-methyltransferase, mitochondrial-like isoform X2 n=1 Tax=Telopea speciosissima TaxID=54955 RepID=UPI001CC6C077|nr:ubiquinone biosynthesis O-methyltransferase, mitochondrial-like isoform X2 [Telopea speciosissima]
MAPKSLKLCRALCCNFPLSRFSISKSSHILQLRSYADVPQSASVEPFPVPAPEISPAKINDRNDGNTGRTSVSSSLNEVELAKFSAIAETWWDSEGPFKPLHALNPTRLSFIRSTLCRHFRKDPYCARPFEGLKIVDVGCGASGPNGSFCNRNRCGGEKYQNCTASRQKLVEEQRKFDAVIALEVIEHVADPAEFCKSLAALTVTDGATVISTVNRSMRSYATAIIAAEYLLHWLPKGTHQWSSFLAPEELVLILERASISVQEIAGFVYNPLTGKWALSDDISVNFIAFGSKNGQ